MQVRLAPPNRYALGRGRCACVYVCVCGYVFRQLIICQKHFEMGSKLEISPYLFNHH